MPTVPASVGAEIELRDLDARSIARLRKALRYTNPEYLKARMSGEEEPGVPSQISACEELAGGVVRMPRGAIDDINKALRIRRVHPVWEDRRSHGEPLDVTLRGVTLRDYQAEGVELLRRLVQGLIVLPCGGGKTFLGIGAIAELKISSLVVVPTRDLVDQWSTDAQKVLGIKPAIFGTGKHDIGPLTIATQAALAFHKDLDLSRFGFVIYDECHRIPARTGQELLARIPARYRLGLTATPEREDGQSKIVQWSFGATLLEKTVDELVEAGFLVLPRIEAIETNFSYNFPEEPHWCDFSRLTDALANSAPRNQTIVDLVCREPEQTWLLLSPSRKAHCKFLAKSLRDRGIDALDCTGDTKKKRRREIMDAFRGGGLRVLVATSLADEGLNIKHLSRIILCLPEGAKGRTAQRLGRTMRPEGDAPIVYDLVDVNVDKLKTRWRNRKSVYRKLGLEIRKCPTLGLFHPTA